MPLGAKARRTRAGVPASGPSLPSISSAALTLGYSLAGFR
jgi:hypothetical protein